MKLTTRLLSIGLIAAMLSIPAYGSNQGRPGRPTPGGSRPGAAAQGRPGNNGPGNAPGQQTGFGGGGPGNRPGNNGNGPGFNAPAPAPVTQRPIFSGFNRPVPPASWRPAPNSGPSFGTILGITLGSAFAASLDYLFNSGYTVSNYGNSTIYLRDVYQMSLLWPDAALYYNNGRLYASQFTYSSPYYNTSRYYQLYNSFCSQYGAPVNFSNSAGQMSASWFGAGGRFVTIEFSSVYPTFGSPSYYTTLKFGN